MTDPEPFEEAARAWLEIPAVRRAHDWLAEWVDTSRPDAEISLGAETPHNGPGTERNASVSLLKRELGGDPQTG